MIIIKTMKLKDYLRMKKLSQRDFAKEIGTTPAAVCHWLKGVRRPSQPMLLKIILATDEKVRVEDF